MALTRDFKQTIQARTAREPAFRRELLSEGIQSLLAGDVGTGKTVLRDYATVGFEELGASATRRRRRRPSFRGRRQPVDRLRLPVRSRGPGDPDQRPAACPRNSQIWLARFLLKVLLTTASALAPLTASFRIKNPC